ncbi:MAG: enoyl-CoA hydratase/isomerase family protein [Acidimicrobiales bacterium]|nr:enoyl-CoA hydratase/isomerase family protein [Myxococcales bacterium]MCB1003751.1 enoyl-CoA hydratase/isomerase family protein [Acidimicrobiales bacterium]
MSGEPVKIVGPDDGVTELWLDDGDKNALNAPMVEALERALARVGEDRDTRVVLVRGSDEIFCSGGDKQMLLDIASGKVHATDIMLTRAMIEVPVPTIAAMQGHAVGGGLVLGLACDVALVAEESRYGCSFMNMGFTPGMGTTRLLASAVGEHIAAEMMYGGQYFRGSHFAGRTQLNYVLPKAKLLRKARQIAARFAEKPRGSLELLKRSLSLPRRRAFEEARTMETMMHEISFAQPETRALIAENYESQDA